MNASPSVSYSYDTASNGKGRLASVGNSASTYQYLGYDQLGRVARASQQTAGITYGPMTYGYNRAGSPAWGTYPSGRTVLFDYDQAGRAKTLSAVGGVTYATLDDAEAAHAYWVNGGIHKMKLGAVNPATQLNYWEHTNYNLRLQPVEIGWGNSAADSSLRGFQYGYGTTNNNGNVLSQTITAAGFTATQAYGYDGVNRLETSAEGTLWSRNHGYDQYGNNWVSAWSGVAPHAVLTPTSQSAYTAANNRLAGFSYDTGGNLTGANSVTYTYDGENRLAATSEIRGGEPYTTAYQYDGEGRRVKKTVGTVNTVYVYDAMGQMIAEYTDASTEQTAATEYVLADHLGSTRALLDAATNTLSCHDYLPFGEELTAGREAITCYTNTDSVKQKFTGKERDTETGLDWFGTRYMSSAQGRFTSPDKPFADQDPYDPQSWNLYSYVRNNPLKFIDELGEAIKYASPTLEVYSNTMRAQSPSYNAALQGFEGDGAPDMVFQVGDAGLDANGVDKAIGLASTSIAPGSTIYGTPSDPNAVIQVPDKLKSVTITIDTSIAKDGSLAKSTMAHEVGHGNDARTNTAQYQSDGQRTKQTKGSTSHDSRPEEKRANDFRNQVKKEKGQFGKQHKQQNKQLEEAEKRRIKELKKQGAH